MGGKLLRDHVHVTAQAPLLDEVEKLFDSRLEDTQPPKVDLLVENDDSRRPNWGVKVKNTEF